MIVVEHQNRGAIGHRLSIEYDDEERGSKVVQQLLYEAEIDAIEHCHKVDGYPKLRRSDPRHLIAQSIRGKPDADHVVRRFTVWVRPANRIAPSPWGTAEAQP